MSRTFRPAELSGSDDSAPTAAELAELAPVARDIETAFAAGDVHPSTGFVDRVMSMITAEPVPHPAIAVGLAVRGLRPGALLRSLGDMWRVAMTGGRPFVVRAQAGALVLAAVVALTSLSGIAAAGAWQLLAPSVLQPGAQTPVPLIPTPSPSVEPTASPEPTRSPDPSTTPTPALPSSSGGPSETPSGDRPSESPSRAPGPTPTARPSERPGQTETPQPTQTPGSTETPHPTDGFTDGLRDSG